MSERKVQVFISESIAEEASSRTKGTEGLILATKAFNNLSANERVDMFLVFVLAGNSTEPSQLKKFRAESITKNQGKPENALDAINLNVINLKIEYAEKCKSFMEANKIPNVSSVHIALKDNYSAFFAKVRAKMFDPAKFKESARYVYANAFWLSYTSLNQLSEDWMGFAHVAIYALASKSWDSFKAKCVASDHVKKLLGDKPESKVEMLLVPKLTQIVAALKNPSFEPSVVKDFVEGGISNNLGVIVALAAAEMKVNGKNHPLHVVPTRDNSRFSDMTQTQKDEKFAVALAAAGVSLASSKLSMLKKSIPGSVGPMGEIHLYGIKAKNTTEAEALKYASTDRIETMDIGALPRPNKKKVTQLVAQAVAQVPISTAGSSSSSSSSASQPAAQAASSIEDISSAALEVEGRPSFLDPVWPDSDDTEHTRGEFRLQPELEAMIAEGNPSFTKGKWYEKDITAVFPALALKPQVVIDLIVEHADILSHETAAIFMLPKQDGSIDVFPGGNNKAPWSEERISRYKTAGKKAKAKHLAERGAAIEASS